MPDAIWIDQDTELPALAKILEAADGDGIGLDTEFLREKTFFPKLCLLQLAASGQIWCVDTIKGGDLKTLVPVLTAAHTPKIIHSARQDLEAFYLTTQRIISPVFDTQIAAGCIGLKPQVGYAELVKTYLNVTLTKGQTRTDWSKRPLTTAQLDYAADDVLYLGEIAQRLKRRLAELGREHWVLEDCAALEDPQLYEPDPALAWMKLRGIAQLEPTPRARAKVIAVWREKAARERDLPRSWILSDTDIFSMAHTSPTDMDDSVDKTLRQALTTPLQSADIDQEPSQDARPTPAQKIVLDNLVKAVDKRAAELQVSAEILAPRGELKALAMGKRDSHALHGWRRTEIGDALLVHLNQ